MLKFNYSDQTPQTLSDILDIYRFFLLSTLRFRKLYSNILKINRSSCFDVDDHDFENVLGINGFTDMVPEDSKEPDRDRKIQQLRKALICKYEELKQKTLEIPEPLNSNLNVLSDFLGLTEAEKFILLFTSVVSNINDDYFDCFCLLSSKGGEVYWQKELARFFSTMTDIDPSEFELALSSRSILKNGGFIRLEINCSVSILYPALYIDSSLVKKYIFCDTKEFMFRFKSECQKAKQAELSLEDFQYLEPIFSRVCDYLTKSIKEKRQGVNILFYGQPGTGKTQLTRVLGKAIGCDVYEVPTCDDDGDPVPDRRSQLVCHQLLLAKNPKALLVFDEAEDIFKNSAPQKLFFEDENTSFSVGKGWMNKILEENVTPTLWLTNSINRMDPAFIRRFDFVIEVPIPPHKQRTKIIRQATQGLVSDRFCDSLAQFHYIAPAVVTRAANVAKEIVSQNPRIDIDSVMLDQINGTLKAQGHKEVSIPALNIVDELYNPVFSTADVDLVQLLKGVQQAQSARICLYGVPGTGKTAWARHLAKCLNKPLIVKKCSDLLSMWVGESEKNIASAFSEAKAENAVLLIDEVDSLLQNRANAHRSWEVTQVNEMLTQMERFDGIFIATTNLLSGMDEACLRRFDLKVKFNYLTSEKSVELFRQYCKEIFKSEKIEEAVLAKVRELKHLTPGDFATVLRRSKFNPLTTTQDFYNALEGECHLKNINQTRRIGF